jgi:hypothetical protein
MRDDQARRPARRLLSDHSHSKRKSGISSLSWPSLFESLCSFYHKCTEMDADRASISHGRTGFGLVLAAV